MQRQKQFISVSKLTPVQLQQRLIYTQSELDKHKKLVEKYQNDYHYNLIDQLQEENQLLKEQIDKTVELENKHKEICRQLENVKEELTLLNTQYEEAQQNYTIERATLVEKIKSLQKNNSLQEGHRLEENAGEKIPNDHPSSPTVNGFETESSWFHRSLLNHKDDED
ncbi:hypothetical protein AB3N04_16910 [Alkalihalophilus sp. As8PL]|uniref:Uncharacterized protein n=1 Tax=Alkalihalophilus sp. As8PL TaxID=3237103 RepID=A0AB39BRB8_9BACI